MEFLRRGTALGAAPASAAALFPGAWNPPTRAHLALAEAALAHAAEVVFVLPRAFPHKSGDGPSPQARLAWLDAIAETNSSFSVALSEGGLFVEMAREFRRLRATPRVLLLCGSDAAHRIVNWSYGEGDPIARQLEEYELLVAPRPDDYRPPAPLAARVHTLDLPADYRLVSSTEARLRLERGEDARSLIPGAIWDDVVRHYKP
jgi:nicotinic acid mononucleotide adenylyltransferase